MIIQLVFRVTILFLYPIIIIIIINFPRENISFYNFFRAEKFNKVLLIIGEMKRWKVYQVLSIGFRSRKEFRKNYSLESTRVLLRLSLSSVPRKQKRKLHYWRSVWQPMVSLYSKQRNFLARINPFLVFHFCFLIKFLWGRHTVSCFNASTRQLPTLVLFFSNYFWQNLCR